MSLPKRLAHPGDLPTWCRSCVTCTLTVYPFSRNGSIQICPRVIPDLTPRPRFRRSITPAPRQSSNQLPVSGLHKGRLRFGFVSVWVIQQLSDFALPYGVTRGLFWLTAIFLEGGVGGIMGYISVTSKFCPYCHCAAAKVARFLPGK